MRENLTMTCRGSGLRCHFVVACIFTSCSVVGVGSEFAGEGHAADVSGSRAVETAFDAVIHQRYEA